MNQKKYWWFPPARGVSVPLNSGDHCKLFFWEKTFKPRAQVFSFGFYQKSFSSASFAARRELFSFFRFLTKHLKHLLNKKQPTTTGASFTGGAKQKTKNKTRDGGYLGSHIDEERSKMRYVV
jgi:hypothetical protein